MKNILLATISIFLLPTFALAQSSAPLLGGDGSNITVKPTGSTSYTNLAQRATYTRNVLDFGAICGWTPTNETPADDTTSITNALNSMTSGGILTIPAGKMCFINSANITIPTGVVVEGLAAGSPGSDAQTLVGFTGFALNPAYKIIMNGGDTLKDLSIIRSNLIANPTSAQVITAVTQWGSETSNAITIPQNIGGVYLDDLFIEGFNTCFIAGSGDFTFSHTFGDCYNGAEIYTAGDDHYVDNVRFEPFYALATNSSSGSWVRPGIAFNMHDGNTGGYFTRNFSFMYRSAVVMNNIGVNTLNGNGFEWDRYLGDSSAPLTIGIRSVNSAQNQEIGNITNGFDIGDSAESLGEQIVAYNNPSVGSSGTALGSGFYMAGAVIQQIFTLSGNTTTGSTLSLTITDSGLVTSPITLTQVATSSDNIDTLSRKLCMQVMASGDLIPAHFSCEYSNPTIVIQWPNTATATVTGTASGGLSETSTAGTGPGSGGDLNSAHIGGGSNGSPILQVGNNVFSWTVNGLFTGDNILPSNWINFNSGSNGRFSVHGLHYSSNTSVGGSGCASGTYLEDNSNDEDGSVVESPATTSCTVTFYSPWWQTPVCTVTSPSGLVITGWTANLTTLVFNHASNSGYSCCTRVVYHCIPPGSSFNTKDLYYRPEKYAENILLDKNKIAKW